MLDIVMIGSSIFEFWGQPQWTNMTVANHAIRGTQSQFWLDKSQSTSLVDLPESTHIIVYCGSNDLIYGNSPDNIVSNVRKLLDNLSSLYPKAKIGYFSIMHCPQKKAANQIEVINQINKRIERFCETTTDKYKFFNFDEFISDDAKWFIEDGLHLTEQAYEMLNTQLSPVLNKWVN